MIDNQNFQMSLYCAGSSYEDGIIEEVLFYEEKGYQYLTANFTPDGYDCVREEFLGVYGTEDHPAGLERGTLEGSTELGSSSVSCRSDCHQEELQITVRRRSPFCDYAGRGQS